MSSVEADPAAHRGIDRRGLGMRVGFAAPDRPELWAWMEDAACRGLGPAEFFGDWHTMAKGRRRCSACPVREICLWWGIVAEWDLSCYRFGIYGGVGPSIRARIATVTGIGYARARFVELAVGYDTTPQRSALITAAA